MRIRHENIVLCSAVPEDAPLLNACVHESLGVRRLGVRENCWTNRLGRPQSAVDYELTRGMYVAL